MMNDDQLAEAAERRLVIMGDSAAKKDQQLARLRTLNAELMDFARYVLEVATDCLPGKSRHPLALEARRLIAKAEGQS